MSKIFEALQQRSTDTPTDLLHRLFAAPPDGQTAPLDGQAAPAEPAPAAPVAEPAPPPADAPRGIDWRTLPIRVGASAPLFPFDLGENYSAEQYKIIRTKLVQHPRKPRLLLISSAGPSDGKSVTAINLAAALSLKSDSPVLLVDGDFRRASIHSQLGLPDAPGLTDVLAGDCPLEAAVVRAQQFPNLYVLPAGAVRPNSVELLDSAAWVNLCARLRDEFHHVVVDSSPVAAVAEYHLLLAAADGVVLVVRPDHTARALCFKALDSIPKEKLVGVIMNCVEDWFLGGGRNKRHHAYYYSRGSRSQAKRGSE